VNDGNYSGIKQDRFRNSEFETKAPEQNRYEGVSRATANTINGPWAENRGRRGDQLRQDNPFENGKLYNWNHIGKGPRDYTRSDQRVHDDVCEILTRDKNVDASEVEVNVNSGVVTLTGKVEDRLMKKYTGKLVDNIPGVKDLHNLLEFDRR
jgi:hypothetical protein